MEEYSVTKYTISKLIDKLTWAEHTAGTLQAENDRLRKEAQDLAEETAAAKKKVAAIKEELEEQKALWSYTYTEKEKYRDLYEELLKGTEEK